ncbi:MAG: hypothetical protein Q9203_003363 [Teloschistes exilis]
MDIYVGLFKWYVAQRKTDINAKLGGPSDTDTFVHRLGKEMEGITENECIETAADIEEHPSKLFSFLELLQNRMCDINDIAISQGYAYQGWRVSMFATNQAMYRKLNYRVEKWGLELADIQDKAQDRWSKLQPGAASTWVSQNSIEQCETLSLCENCLETTLTGFAGLRNEVEPSPLRK